MYGDVMKGSARGCGGTSQFFGESENRIVEFGAVGVKALFLFRENACAKSEKTGAELLFDWGFVQRGGCEVRQRQRDLFVQQLLTDLNKSLTALAAISEANREGGSTGCLTVLYVPEQRMLLNALHELGDDDVAGFWQCTVLDERAAAADDVDHAVKEKEVLFCGRCLIEHQRDGGRVFVADIGAVFLDTSCTQAPLPKAAQLVSEPPKVLLAAGG